MTAAMAHRVVLLTPNFGSQQGGISTQPTLDAPDQLCRVAEATSLKKGLLVRPRLVEQWEIQMERRMQSLSAGCQLVVAGPCWAICHRLPLDCRLAWRMSSEGMGTRRRWRLVLVRVTGRFSPTTRHLHARHNTEILG